MTDKFYDANKSTWLSAVRHVVQKCRPSLLDRQCRNPPRTQTTT